jgi:hypothetical protein
MENTSNNLAQYEYDDIVVFYMWKRSYVGQIKKVGSWYMPEVELIDSKMIIPLEDCDHFKYTPHVGRVWYENLGYNEELKEETIKVTCVSVEIKDIRFSIKREDINRYLQSQSEGERFKILLRGYWKDLVVRKVKTVVLPSKEMSVEKISIDTKYGIIREDMIHETCMNGTSFEERYRSADGTCLTEVGDTFYLKLYSRYFGFTSKFGANDREIYFSQDNYKGFDFDVESTCWFSNYGNHNGGYIPPLKGQFVCGIVKSNTKGLYYDQWFTCSQQFFNFWKFIMSNDEVRESDKPNLLKSVDLEWLDYKLTEDQRKVKLRSYKTIANNKVRCSEDCNYECLIEYILTDNKIYHPDSSVADIIRNIIEI